MDDLTPLLKRSPALALVLAPLLGALFCLFLPVIGFVLVGEALWKKFLRPYLLRS